MARQETQEQIDAVLDAALNDLDDDDDSESDEVAKASSISGAHTANEVKPKPVHGPEPPPSFPGVSPDLGDLGGLDTMMQQLMKGGNGIDENGDAFLGQLLQEMQSQIGAELEKMESSSSPKKPEESPPKSIRKDTTTTTTTTTKQSTSHSTKSPSKSSPNKNDENNSTNNDVDQAIASLIEGVSNQTKMKNSSMPVSDGSEAEMVRSMMSQFGEGFGDDDVNADALIDGMMEQLLSKDLMYDPIKKVSEKFPEWLERNKGNIPDAEYSQRFQQYKCFKKLVHTYDTEPNNMPTLMLLMQEVHEFGQPPPEIIKDIAPGLELDADGLPKMGADANFPFSGEDEECRIS